MVGREQTSQLPLATLSHGRSRPPVKSSGMAGARADRTPPARSGSVSEGTPFGIAVSSRAGRQPDDPGSVALLAAS